MVTNEIKIQIHEESDLYASYDPEQKMISDDVSDYVIRCYENKHRRTHENLVIHIFSDTPVDEERVKQAIRDYCEQEKSNNQHEITMETLREVALAVLGLIFLSLWIILSASHEGIWMEVLSIMGSVAIWEATSIAIMTRPGLYHMKKTFERASKAQIIIDVAEADA